MEDCEMGIARSPLQEAGLIKIHKLRELDLSAGGW
jgi:hypothetical protein